MVFDCNCHIVRKRSQGGVTAEDLMALLREGGIEKACIMPMAVSTDEDETRRLNDFIQTEAIGYRAIEGFCSVNPHMSTAVEEVDRGLRELGLKGLCVDPEAQKFHFTDDEFWTILEVVAAQDVPVFCMTSESDYFDTGEINETVMGFPKVSFVFSQMGLPNPDAMFSRVMNEKNVYFETSKAPIAYIKSAIEEYGAEKVVFGSGFRGEDYPTHEIGKIQDLDLDEKEETKILGENFEELIGPSVKAPGFLKRLPFFK